MGIFISILSEFPSVILCSAVVFLSPFVALSEYSQHKPKTFAFSGCVIFALYLVGFMGYLTYQYAFDELARGAPYIVTNQWEEHTGILISWNKYTKNAPRAATLYDLGTGQEEDFHLATISREALDPGDTVVLLCKPTGNKNSVVTAYYKADTGKWYCSDFEMPSSDQMVKIFSRELFAFLLMRYLIVWIFYRYPRAGRRRLPLCIMNHLFGLAYLVIAAWILLAAWTWEKTAVDRYLLTPSIYALCALTLTEAVWHLGNYAWYAYKLHAELDAARAQPAPPPNPSDDTT